MAKHLGLWALVATSIPLFAADPMGSCRVKTTVMHQFANVANNAGCVIGRLNGRKNEVVMVRQNGSEKWGVPGGTSAVKAKDLLEPGTKEMAERIPFDYTEAVVCTAGRETREETGLDVVVSDLVMIEKNFHSFVCLPLDANPKFAVKDHDEIAEVKWVPVDDVLAGKVPLRFESNKEILRRYLAQKR